MSAFYIENGNLWACGANSFGELGLGDNDERSIFTKVPLGFDVTEVFSCYTRTVIKDEDDNLWISGANPANKNNLYECLTNVFVKIPTKFKIKKISCIRYHIMAIDHNGNLWGYGRNDEGQLGLGDFDYRESFEKIPLNFPVSDVSCGSQHTVIKDDLGNIWACGSNDYGQLCLNDRKSKNIFTQIYCKFSVDTVICGVTFTLIKDQNGSFWFCGRSNYGYLEYPMYPCSGFNKIPNLSIDIADIVIAPSDSFFMVIDTHRNLWACGDNKGQLGLGDYNCRNKLTKVPINFQVDSVSCGTYFTIIKDFEGNIWSCGNNYEGQLGFNDKIDRCKFNKIPVDFVDNIMNQYCSRKIKIKSANS